jgi:hypothetical protein
VSLQNRNDHRRSVFQQVFAQTHTEQKQHHAARTVAPDPGSVPSNAHLIKSEERKTKSAKAQEVQQQLTFII